MRSESHTFFYAKMAGLSNPLVMSKSHALHASFGSSLNSIARNVDQTYLALNLRDARRSLSRKRDFTTRANYGDGGKPSSGSLFVGGFVLGGLIVGTLSCVYAPQISKALIGTDKKDLMKKLPRFLYDEEKALEKQRKKLTHKIAQLNSAIDNVSTQLRPEVPPNEATESADNVEALI